MIEIKDGSVIISYLDNPWLSKVLNTDSMIPTFDYGDCLITEAPINLKVGDIVIWQRKLGEPLSCHRIVRIKDNWVQTKGDHNWFSDKWFPITDVRYRVKGIIYREG